MLCIRYHCKSVFHKFQQENKVFFIFILLIWKLLPFLMDHLFFNTFLI